MKIIYLLVLLNLPLLSIAEDKILLEQGQTQLTFEDVDGFAFKMPNNIRSGFFRDVGRVEETLNTLLNMKHVYNYLVINDKLDKNNLNTRVTNKVNNLFAIDTEVKNIMEKEATYKIIRKFIEIEESYRMFQEDIVKNVNENELVEYAKEKFLLNNKDYQLPETRTIQYISLPFSSLDKQIKHEFMVDLNNKLYNYDIKYDQVNHMYKKKYPDIVVSNKLEHITYNFKQKKFSDLVFTNNNIGVVNKVIELTDKFLIVNVYKINKERQATFLESKEKILEGLKNAKSKRIFNNFIMKLNEDPIRVHENNLDSLLTRYQK